LKILIIRFSSIGDIVLTTPVVRCLKNQIKEVELHYITKPQFHEILSANPYIHKIYTLKENLLETIGALRQEKFDYVIDLHHNQRTFLIKQALLTKSRSFHKMNIEKWLMVNFRINRMKPIHLVDRYMEAVKPLKVTNDGKGLDYFISEKDEVPKSALPASHLSGYISWVIGAVHNTKRFPAHKITAVCRKIQTPLILLGGENEFPEGEQIAASAGDHIFNACGKFSLNQSASLIRQSRAVVTNDTGLMHIAAAFQKPIISLWGNTIPEFGMYPYYGNRKNQAEILEVKGLNCRPCSKLGFKTCPKKHFKCMELIPENQLIELLKKAFH